MRRQGLFILAAVAGLLAVAGCRRTAPAAAPDATVAPPPPVAPPPAPSPVAVQRWAVVLVRGDDVLNQRAEPNSEAPLVQALAPNLRGIEATGRTTEVGAALWREVRHGGKTGWVNSAFLTPDIKAARFEADPRVQSVLQAWVQAVEQGADTASLLSPRGIYLSHFGAPKWYPPAKARALWADPSPAAFNGPACGDACLQGSAREVVGQRLVRAYQASDRQLRFAWWKTDGNASALAAPAQLVGFRQVTIYDPQDQTDVPDWGTATVFFEYVDDAPKVVGMAFNAWSP